MRILSWNCRGLGGTSTVSQLRASLRLNLPDIIFLCETKQPCSFVAKVISKLHFNDRWDTVEPDGRKGGMLVAWTQNVEVKQIRKNNFCIEMQIRSDEVMFDQWFIFVYASTDANMRKQQWDFVRARKEDWGDMWVIGGDFNDIKSKDEKKGDRVRQDYSF